MRNPDIYTATTIKDWSVYEAVEGDYRPVRPLPFYGIRCFDWR